MNNALTPTLSGLLTKMASYALNAGGKFLADAELSHAFAGYHPPAPISIAHRKPA